ncbi:MAG: hypothetical protein QOH85_1488 [Acidobacteriaceae bacterium]|nr:hypothetical protein [Acidobacteriaceae bacterium]
MYLCLISIIGISLLCCGSAGAQVVPAAAHGSGLVMRADSDVPAPVLPGWSATLSTTAAHDSLIGRSLLESPSVSYRFDRHFSMDASVPVYAYMIAAQTGKNGKAPVAGREAVLGDAALSGHMALQPRTLDYLATLSFSAPTGDEHLGVGTGHLGWNLSHHVEREAGLFTPELEIGIGSTSSLVRRRSVKSYTSSGLLASLQAGTAVTLPARLNLDAEAYEQLPLGAQTVYSRVNRKKGGAVLTRASDAEDNGVNLELDAPPMRRLLLSSNFSHSVRLGDTSEGVTLGFLLVVPRTH